MSRRSAFAAVAFFAVSAFIGFQLKPGNVYLNKQTRRPASVTTNTFPVVAGSCGSSNRFNLPCVSVTVCAPGTNNCTTINNILLDTGSTGLRIFSSLLKNEQGGDIPLPASPAPTGSSVAECYLYGDGTYGFWGPVKTADIQLGGEKASNVPVQIADSTFGQLPPTCKGPYPNPAALGFNGIMGVNEMVQDCGADCVQTNNANGSPVYYLCNGTACTASSLPLAQQVIDPIAMLPTDNNGFSIQFPAVDPNGASSLTGVVTLGIGTQSNNAPPASLNVVPTGFEGFVTATFNNTNFKVSALDTGTGSYVIGGKIPQLPTCTNPNFTAAFCPTSTLSLTGTLNGQGVAPVNMPFEIANFETLASQPNVTVFMDDGQNGGDLGGFLIWGIPFFYGKTIYIGFAGQGSALGTGPLVAF